MYYKYIDNILYNNKNKFDNYAIIKGVNVVIFKKVRLIYFFIL